jgi:hypothetical protein
LIEIGKKTRIPLLLTAGCQLTLLAFMQAGYFDRARAWCNWLLRAGEDCLTEPSSLSRRFKKQTSLDAMEPAMRQREAVIDVYKLAVGLFLIGSPWLFAFPYSPARTNAVAAGALLTVISGLAILVFAKWEEWISLLIGCWVLISPWVLGFPHSSSMHVAVFVGITVIYLSFLELWLIYNPDWSSPVSS